MTEPSHDAPQQRIPSYQEIAEQTFGTLWAEAEPADWALVVHKLRQALAATPNGNADLVKRLREFAERQKLSSAIGLCLEAADALERTEQRNGE